jgi:hypothetical protein
MQKKIKPGWIISASGILADKFKKTNGEFVVIGGQTLKDMLNMINTYNYNRVYILNRKKFLHLLNKSAETHCLDIKDRLNVIESFADITPQIINKLELDSGYPVSNFQSRPALLFVKGKHIIIFNFMEFSNG